MCRNCWRAKNVVVLRKRKSNCMQITPHCIAMTLALAIKKTKYVDGSLMPSYPYLHLQK